ncbi:MAG: shikimate dehydrogenase [Bacteroidia bacterium]
MNHYGLIGKTLDHSFSKSYFETKFKNEKIEASYHNLELESLNNLFETAEEFNLKGFNVTIPYKQEIIQYLNRIDSIAAEINAVNAVVKRNGSWVGYNTDYSAFIHTLSPFLKSSMRALIFGNGGASQAIQYALRDVGINYLVVARSNCDLVFEELDENLIGNHHLLVNCTPIGTDGYVTQEIPFPKVGLSSNHIAYDLVYNPHETPFLKSAKKAGGLVLNGYKMLVRQAEESWSIWNEA